MKTPANAPGRKEKQVWYDSMAQWAAVTGRPLSDAKRAKLDPVAGKKFFRHTRVSSWLTYWVDENPVADLVEVSEKERLQAEKLAREIRKLDFEEQKELGKYALVSEQKAAIAKFMEVVQGIISTFVDKGIQERALEELKKQIKELNI